MAATLRSDLHWTAEGWPVPCPIKWKRNCVTAACWRFWQTIGPSLFPYNSYIREVDELLPRCEPSWTLRPHGFGRCRLCGRESFDDLRVVARYAPIMPSLGRRRSDLWKWLNLARAGRSQV